MRTVSKFLSAMSVVFCTQAYAQNVRLQKTPDVTEGSTLVGARIGAIDVDYINDLALSYGVFGDFALGDNFTVGGTIDYWSSGDDVGRTRVQVDDLALGVNGKFIFAPAELAVKPYVVGGLALHRFSVDVAEEQVTDSVQIERYRDIESDVSGELGVDLGGGALYQLQEGIDLTGELRWRRLLDRTVDLDQLAFTGSLSYRM